MLSMGLYFLKFGSPSVGVFCSKLIFGSVFLRLCEDVEKVDAFSFMSSPLRCNYVKDAFIPNALLCYLP